MRRSTCQSCWTRRAREVRAPEIRSRMGLGPCCFHVSMANCPHGLKPILHLVIGFTVVTLAAPSALGSGGNVSTLIARDRETIVGPEASPFNMPTDVAVGG